MTRKPPRAQIDEFPTEIKRSGNTGQDMMRWAYLMGYYGLDYKRCPVRRYGLAWVQEYRKGRDQARLNIDKNLIGDL